MRAIRPEDEPVEVAAPVILYSFDRPDYLRRVCAGLRAQRGARLDPAGIWLLQDGAVSPHTGRRRGDPAAIAASIAVFREAFPAGQVLDSAHNLGVAHNILRGERLAFETLDAPLAYFFEDDLEPGPHYLWALEQLRRRSEAEPRIAYFGAYGDHRRDYPGPEVKYIPLEHHWGFGLYRRAWRRMADWLAPYYALLEGRDYNDRDHGRIFRLWEGLSIASEASSQDAAKSIACLELGLSRVLTTVSFGRYIGERGNSFSPAHFRAMGFDRHRIVAAEAFAFHPLDPARLEAVDAHHRRHYERLRRERFDAILAAHPARG
ncbi:hypothetical protein [Teichococcus aerofrigidensis]